jgi:hypothetical protein
MSADSMRAADVVAWAWANLRPELAPSGGDPAGALPPIDPLTTTFYWELHLRNGEVARADFLHRPSLIASAPAGEGKSADGLLADLRAWYANSALAQRHLHPSVWLEADGPFDDARAGRAQGVSVCLDPAFGEAESRERVVLDDASLGRLCDELESACQRPLGRAATILRLQAAVLRAGGDLRHLSLMVGRNGSPSKVYAAIPKPAFASFLDAAGWPGDHDAACSLAERVCDGSRKVNVDLLIEDDLAPQIGFELFSDPSAAPDFQRAPSVALAQEMSLISAAQAAGLAEWSGRFRRPFGADDWPTYVRRWFDLKFVRGQEGRINLKAYLGFRIQPSVF